MHQPPRRGGLVGPILLIGLGVLFLLDNLGVQTIDFWNLIFRLWPLLLIAVGIDLLVGRRSPWGWLISLVLILAVFAGGYLLYTRAETTGVSVGGIQVAQPLEGAKEATVSLKPGVAFLNLAGSDDTTNLVLGTVALYRGLELGRDVTRVGDNLNLTLGTEGTAGVFVPLNLGRSLRWDLTLTTEIPIRLELELGVGDSDIDLSGIQLTGLDIQMGVGQVTVVLPETGRFEAEVDGAVGSLTIIVPKGMETRVRFDTGIASRQVPSSFKRSGETFASPGYDGAENRVDLQVKQAIGTVTIRQRE